MKIRDKRTQLTFNVTLSYYTSPHRKCLGHDFLDKFAVDMMCDYDFTTGIYTVKDIMDFLSFWHREVYAANTRPRYIGTVLHGIPTSDRWVLRVRELF